MRVLHLTAAAAALATVLIAGPGPQASARGLLAPPSLDATVGDALVDRAAPGATKVAHRSGKRKARAKSRRARDRAYRRHHRRFHQRYRRGDKHYRRAHRRFHRHYGRRHRRDGIYIGIYPYYDPWYYDPFYYDPYYDHPHYGYNRLSCNRVRRILRRHGYRHIRAYDCRGRVYGFYARKRGKRYKLRVSAYTGAIRSRRRIRR